MVTYFRAPRSYTGEDMVEITCHGGLVMPGRVIGLLKSAGCRLARPGEFSYRACLNGKMSLAQAEAVNELVHARTEVAHERALERYQAGRSGPVARLRARLVALLAELEFCLGIDDAHEHPGPNPAAEIRTTVQELGRLIRDAERERLVFRGANVVIVGRPNVGKSSLFNCLVERGRAIVSSRPGTTRDTVTAEVEMRGVPVRLSDTAGLPARAGSRLASQAAEQARAALDGADLVVVVFDRSRPAARADRSVLAAAADRPMVAVLNKSDLSPRLDSFRLLGSRHSAIAVSCHTGVGLCRLRRRLGQRLGPLSNHALVVGDRQLAVLRACHEALKRGQAAPDIETAALEMRAAVDMLGQVDAPVSSSEILARVFADFCVGK